MERKRQIAYDILRILAICMVVIIHANVSTIASVDGWKWSVITVMTSMLTVAVPIFFMISGALLLDVEEPVDIRILFQKRIKKLLVPFVIWSNIYVVIRIIMRKLPFAFSSFVKLIEEPAYYQFWFIYSLLAIYLLLPILQRLLLKCSKQNVEYILILWGIFSLIIPSIEFVSRGIKLCEHLDLNFVEGYLGYFILGYYLKKYRNSCTVRKSLACLLVGLFFTVACVIVEQTIGNGAYWSQYFMSSYVTPFVMLYAIGLFELVVGLVGKYGLHLKENVKLGIQSVSKMTMGVFYIHMLVLTTLEYTGWFASDSFVMLAVKSLITILCSFVGSYIIGKIPILRKILV